MCSTVQTCNKWRPRPIKYNLCRIASKIRVLLGGTCKVHLMGPFMLDTLLQQRMPGRLVEHTIVTVGTKNRWCLTTNISRHIIAKWLSIPFLHLQSPSNKSCLSPQYLWAMAINKATCWRHRLCYGAQNTSGICGLQTVQHSSLLSLLEIDAWSPLQRLQVFRGYAHGTSFNVISKCC